LLLTSPSTASFQESGLAGASGICPLLRMKNFSVGVVSSSRSCSGVSATSGRSPRTTRPGFLPGKLSGCGPFGAAGGWPPEAGAPCASAAGTSPAGMVAAKGTAPPTAAPIAASPAPLKKPRRFGPARRPKTSASARSGSSA
jgi:hypothetical protein